MARTVRQGRGIDDKAICQHGYFCGMVEVLLTRQETGIVVESSIMRWGRRVIEDPSY